MIGLLLTLAVVFFVLFKKYYTPKYQWYPDYRKKTEQPYGLSLLYKVISDQHKKVDVYTQHTLLSLDTNDYHASFIAIGNDFFPDSTEGAHLMQYVEKGNCVFIASDYSPMEVISRFVPIGDTIHSYSEIYDSVATAQFVDDSLRPLPGSFRFVYQFLKDTIRTNWNGYKAFYVKDTLMQYSVKPFGLINKHLYTSFTIPHGKGQFVIQSCPVLFTNYYFRQKAGFDYVSKHLALLYKDKIHWYDPTSEKTEYSQHGGAVNNPLKLFFSHRSLRWAWYVFLVTVFLYLVFRSKREQRIIPILPVNENTSVEFTKAIGSLYFKSNNHRRMAQEMYLVFMAEARNRYFLSPNLSEEEMITQISVRSGIALNTIHKLFKQFSQLRESTDVSSDDIESLHNAIEYYHKKRK